MRTRFGRAVWPAVFLTALAVLATACSPATANSAGPGQVVAIGAENEYADVIAQVGGKYVAASAIMSNPATDPHSYEASQAVAQQISQAQLVVQNGLGYDTFMGSIEAAAANPGTKIVDVQKLLGLPDSTPNPHLWYQPATMPKVAAAVASDLAAIQPQHAAYFRANLRTFDQSLVTFDIAVAQFRTMHPGFLVATTEPVADYLLTALGAANQTPWSLRADIMNGVDPAPQAVAATRALFSQHKVKVLLYNRQVTDPLVQSLVADATSNHIPVVGVYETMPAGGYDYQSWMLSVIKALEQHT